MVKQMDRCIDMAGQACLEPWLFFPSFLCPGNLHQLNVYYFSEAMLCCVHILGSQSGVCC